MSQFVPGVGPVIPASGGGGGGSAGVLWKPGAPSGNGQYATWAEVYAVIQATPGRVVVFTDGSLALPVIPAGLYDLGSRVMLEPSAPKFSLRGPPLSCAVSLSDGAVLHNLLSITESLRLIGNQTTAPCLTFGANSTLQISTGALLENLGSRPMIDVDSILAISMRYGGTLNGNVPLFHVLDGALLALSFFSGPFLINDFLSGTPLSSLVWLHDNSVDLLPQSGFLGSLIFDARKSLTSQDDPAMGDTASRPSGPAPYGPRLGQMYFDTTIGFPVWYNGSIWVDASGAPA